MERAAKKMKGECFPVIERVQKLSHIKDFGTYQKVLQFRYLLKLNRIRCGKKVLMMLKDFGGEYLLKNNLWIYNVSI
jgi:hypothetical protein